MTKGSRNPEVGMNLPFDITNVCVLNFGDRTQVLTFVLQVLDGLS